MKMKYERPVMQAELYQTNAYCNSCGTKIGFLDRASLILNTATGWFKLGGGNSQTEITDDATISSILNDYGNLEFKQTSIRPMTSRADNTQGWAQYYWTTQHNGSQYYLEYSVGRTEENDGRDTFVLYRENSTHASDDGEWVRNGFLDYEWVQNVPLDEQGLNINWGGYTGSDSDNNSALYDDSLYGFDFDDQVITNS